MKKAMAVEGGAKCVKYLLFFFNFIFWLCGLALTVLGIVAYVHIRNTAVANISTSPAVWLIVVGVIIFFIAFFGCCGAWKENYCMVTTFAVILSIIIICEIAGAIAAYIFRGKLSGVLDQGFKEAIAGYNTSKEAQKALDSLQQELKCCGANSSDDWVNFSASRNSVPDSCCKNMTDNCGKGAIHDTNKIYTNGCQPALETLLNKSMLWIAVGALVIAFIQITGIVLACILMRAIRSGYEVM
ncbi:CD63 antigen-like [Myxocyprinus asiaticus]|uniref:CD63 antigen-like n=1 Tax=Myxocyprinus asiaticus TaxID=70543 RepID=UPI002221B5C7|nr:CD63 antigen-like [Myxocyprinus asiaticus]